MKKVSFKITNKKYEKINKKLKSLDLSWDLVGTQVTDLLLSADNLDKNGLVTHLQSRSYFKSAITQLEGPIEQALTEYLKIEYLKKIKSQKISKAKLARNLKQICVINKSKILGRDFILDKTQLNAIIKDLWAFAKTLVSAELGIESNQLKIKMPNIEILREAAV